MERITPDTFHADPELTDWRLEPDGLHADFTARDFAHALVFVGAVGVLAEGAGHHPDLDIRYADVHVRLFTHDADAVTTRDTDLARQISATAREHGVTARPGGAGATT